MPSNSTGTTAIGVGIDTARYAHHVTFLKEDGQQPATRAFHFKESKEGYQRLLKTLLRLQEQYPQAHFYLRIDAAGQYALNLEGFLRGLSIPKTISVGESNRNKAYRQVLFPKRKSDPADSHALARFAVIERPRETRETPTAFYALREVASRLESQSRQCGRCLNQLHNLLSRVFPELSVLVFDLAASWVLRLLNKYPTPEKLARAHLDSLKAIPYLSDEMAMEIRQAAQQTVGTFRGATAESLVKQAVQELLHAQAMEKKLETLLEETYQTLPPSNHQQIETIPGLGLRTVAALVAKMISIDRFETPASLVGYFGIFPEEDTSGTDKHGKPVAPGAQRMSRKGNDLVRKYLWMAAMVAVQHNPAIRALHERLKARNVKPSVALGHCMRKLLHLVFAIWKSGKPFDPGHYPWGSTGSAHAPDTAAHEKTAAGHNQDSEPGQQVVTAATGKIPAADGPVQQMPVPASPAQPTTPATTQPGLIDFQALRSELSMERVLRHLKLFDDLHGRNRQLRGPCPICGKQNPRKRSFSVNLNKHVFRCLNPDCGIQGNALDLWATLKQQSVYEAAVDLASTFGLTLRGIREEATR
ncbi:MAG: IS110 family transposase [Pirellulaceae bacterium]|nr:IS110 family transposase [Pirellulaceae bacterium]